MIRWIIIIGFILTYSESNVQKECEIYKHLLQDLGQASNKIVIIIPEGEAIDIFNFDEKNYESKIITYKYNPVVINDVPLRFNKYDFKYWFQYKFNNTGDLLHENLSNSLFDFQNCKEVNHKFNDRPIVANYDSTTLIVELSEILFDNNNAFVFAKCKYPHEGSNLVYHLYWFIIDKEKKNWILKEETKEIR